MNNYYIGEIVTEEPEINKNRLTQKKGITGAEYFEKNKKNYPDPDWRTILVQSYINTFGLDKKMEKEPRGTNPSRIFCQLVNNVEDNKEYVKSLFGYKQDATAIEFYISEFYNFNEECNAPICIFGHTTFEVPTPSGRKQNVVFILYFEEDLTPVLYIPMTNSNFYISSKTKALCLYGNDPKTDYESIKAKYLDDLFVQTRTPKDRLELMALGYRNDNNLLDSFNLIQQATFYEKK